MVVELAYVLVISNQVSTEARKMDQLIKELEARKIRR
jgi:hypothetical protein